MKQASRVKIIEKDEATVNAVTEKKLCMKVGTNKTFMRVISGERN